MKKTQPDILWLMTDEQRCDSLGCYGSRWAHSPNVDALAAEGAVFETAVTPAPVCVPARTSVLAGKYPCQTGVWHNHLDRRRAVPNLMGRFREAGYQTATFGKQHYAGAGTAFAAETGPCLSEHVGYFNYAERHNEALFDVVKYPGNIYNWIFGGRFPAPPEETAEAIVVKNAMAWLDTRPSGNPFFLRLSFNGPHTPVSPPAPFDSIVDPDIVLPGGTELPEASPGWLAKELRKCADASVLSPEQRRKMRQYYFGEVGFLDTLFGRLLDWMRKRGLLENTIVAYLSDHGTHLGDYGLVQKQTFYDPVVNVPFIFWYPSQIAGATRFHAPVETRSLLPTLADLAGLEPIPDGVSPSLASCLRTGREPEPRPVFSEFSLNSFAPHIKHHGRLVMVRQGNWKLSACVDPEINDVALYNLQSDPHELANCAAEDPCKSHREELLELVRKHLSEGEHSHRCDA